MVGRVTGLLRSEGRGGVWPRKERSQVRNTSRGLAYSLGALILEVRDGLFLSYLVVTRPTFPSITSRQPLPLPSHLLPYTPWPLRLLRLCRISYWVICDQICDHLPTLPQNRFSTLVLSGKLAPGAHRLVSKGTSAQPARPLHIPATM